MGVLFADKVFVEPVCLFDLKTYASQGNEFLSRDVNDEAAVPVTVLATRWMGVIRGKREKGRWQYHERSSKTSSNDAV